MFWRKYCIFTSCNLCNLTGLFRNTKTALSCILAFNGQMCQECGAIEEMFCSILTFCSSSDAIKPNESMLS